MKEIPLTQEQYALVDDEDFEYLNQWKWHVKKSRNTFYARRHLLTIDGKQPTVHMHYEIIGKPPKGFEVDHKNGRGTDNQRHNLRFVTRRQNGQNLQNRKKSSQYPGVYWYKRDEIWKAQIWINGKRKHLGYFVNEHEAFEIYRQTVNGIGEEMIGK